MKPGIYPNMSNFDYHASDGISRSGISLLLKCPELYHKRKQKPETASMRIGSALHKTRLEPDAFSKEYIVAPSFNKRSKDGKAEFEKWQQDNQGKKILDQDDYDTVMAMNNAISMHPIAGEIFDYPGLAEYSIFSEHEQTGELCKVRPDWMQDDILVDLKSTSDASQEAFAKDCYNFDYHIQAGMYLPVCRQAGLHLNTFMFVVVENKEPFSVAVYVASKDMIEFGEQRFHEGMEIYSRCKKDCIWPGYNSDRIETIDLPVWAYKQRNFITGTF